jgi:hypothetical protein
MDPIFSMAYYLESQRQLSDAKGAWREPLVENQKEMSFQRPHAHLSKRIKVEATDIVLAILSLVALVTLGLACFLSPTLLT